MVLSLKLELLLYLFVCYYIVYFAEWEVCYQMASFRNSEVTQSLGNKDGKRTKRQRLLDDDEIKHADDDLRQLLSKELANYLDRNIIHVEINNCCNEESQLCEEQNERNESAFQLFSSSSNQGEISIAAESKEKLNLIVNDTNNDLSSSDDEEMIRKLKESAVSVADLFGSRTSTQ
ncbi:uncharacterized protein LOC124434088 isoform X1 [Xenia sp. Carnegie-2017]|uniref:uncharacterized protein LOC124434088 isoform X1 n=1 Tax=Xenia sp. Carnegie-2017 TaxID=2897299 RepID=UPI001F04D2A2|nr:uncharacterized protein LOC124434088 isoform X1 [Xenia sp. Carnegie-2017]